MTQLKSIARWEADGGAPQGRRALNWLDHDRVMGTNEKKPSHQLALARLLDNRPGADDMASMFKTAHLRTTIARREIPIAGY